MDQKDGPCVVLVLEASAGPLGAGVPEESYFQLGFCNVSEPRPH